jgi:hypothetical protein
VQGAADGRPQCRPHCVAYAWLVDRTSDEVGRRRDGWVEERGQVEWGEEG